MRISHVSYSRDLAKILFNWRMKCPMCNGDSIAEKIFPPKPLPLYFCSQCLGAFFDTNMTETQLSDFYNSNYEHYLHTAAIEFDAGIYEKISNQVDWVLNSTTDLKDSFDLVIEYGSSYPVLAARLKQLIPSLEFICVEPNEDARKWGEVRGIRSVSDYRELSLKRRRILVVYNHVLEHLPDPAKIIKHVYRKTLSGSVGIGTVPNWNSLIARLDKSNWEWFAYPEHLNYFTPLGMTLMIKKLHLQLDEIYTLNDPQNCQSSASRAGVDFSHSEMEILNRSLLGNEIRFKFTTK